MSRHTQTDLRTDTHMRGRILSLGLIPGQTEAETVLIQI